MGIPGIIPGIPGGIGPPIGIGGTGIPGGIGIPGGTGGIPGNTIPGTGGRNSAANAGFGLGFIPGTGNSGNPPNPA
jgi:hypothetical protein